MANVNMFTNGKYTPMTDRSQLLNKLTPNLLNNTINTTFKTKNPDQLDSLASFLNTKQQTNNIISPTPSKLHCIPVLGKYLIKKK